MFLSNLFVQVPIHVFMQRNTRVHTLKYLSIYATSVNSSFESELFFAKLEKNYIAFYYLK